MDRIDRLEATLIASRSGLESRQNGSPTITIRETGPSRSGGNSLLSSANQSFITVEAVLCWPVLKGEYKPYLDIRDLIANSDNPCADTSSSPSFGTLAASSLTDIELESCLHLVDNFFRYVHIKNPVLDEVEVRGWVRQIALNGVGWDARSCLVVGFSHIFSLSSQ